MNYETRKRKLKRLIRPEPGAIAECCGTPIQPAHRYTVASCECTRAWKDAPQIPLRVRRLLEGMTGAEEFRMTRELVDEFADERAAKQP